MQSSGKKGVLIDLLIEGAVPKKEIAQRTGLSVGHVVNYACELRKDGILPAFHRGDYSRVPEMILAGVPRDKIEEATGCNYRAISKIASLLRKQGHVIPKHTKRYVYTGTADDGTTVVFHSIDEAIAAGFSGSWISKTVRGLGGHTVKYRGFTWTRQPILVEEQQ